VSTSASNAAAGFRIPTGPKVTLMILAAHSCQFCGLTWLGIKRMQDETGMGETSVRAALRHLVDAGLLLVHAYPLGGRGRATEYIVLPDVPRGVEKLSTPPCGKCLFNQAKGPSGEGFDKSKTEKTPRVARGIAKTPRVASLNPVPGYAPTEKNTTTITPHARAREADPSPAAAGPATPASSDPPTPAQRAQARRMVAKINRAISSSTWGDRRYSAKDGSDRPLSEGNGAPPVPGSVTEVSSGEKPTTD
jgi:hypothetical protein